MIDENRHMGKDGDMTSTLLPEERVERLSTASTRRVLEPEELFDWSSLGDGQIIADELLSTHGLGLDLTAEQKVRLSREEVPDLLQKRAAEHPDTDPLLAAVNRYHRQEEARHLAFARMHLPELWDRAGKIERWRVLPAPPAGHSPPLGPVVPP